MHNLGVDIMSRFKGSPSEVIFFSKNREFRGEKKFLKSSNEVRY